MNIQFDIQPTFKRFVINKMMPLDSVLDFLGIEYSIGSNMYCPFHDDTNHPSAKFFTSPEGGGSIWCFSEQKMYFSSHAITLLGGKNIDDVFYKLWGGLGEVEKQSLLSLYDKPLDVLPVNWDKGKESLSPFKQGRMDYSEFLVKFLSIVTGDETIHA